MEEKTNERFTRKEAADYLGVSVVTIDRLVSSKKLGHFRIGTRVIFDREKHLDEFLISCEQKTKKAVMRNA